MALERKPARKTRPAALSFRFSDDGAEKLKVLATVLNLTQVELIETLVSTEFEEAKKRYPKEFAKAVKKKRE